MTPVQAEACTTALEEGKSQRAITGISGAMVSYTKLHKHIAAHPIWGAWVQALIERNFRWADRKKGHMRNRTVCKHGHDMSVHGRTYLQRDGRLHRQCMACTGFRHSNPTHTPKPDLVAKVVAAIERGQRVSVFTQKFKKRDTFICDFRQLRAVRRLRPELESKIFKNAERPVIIRPAKRRVIRPPSGPFIVHSNVRAPALTGIIAAQADPLFTLADNSIARSVRPDIRRMAVNLLSVALWLGEVKPEDVGKASMTFVRAAWAEDSGSRRFVSLDAPRFRNRETSWIETIGENQGIRA